MDATTTSADVESVALPESLAEGVRILALKSLGDVDAAEDVVQETLARALEALRCGRHSREGSVGAYVRGIARHVIVDEIRARRRERGMTSLSERDIATGDATALDALVRGEDVARLTTALARLPRSDRRLLERIYVRGERVVDMARAAGEPPERLRKRKSRALERLRTVFRAAP